MNFLVAVLLVSLGSPYALSSKCSQTLHDAFKKGFNLTYATDNCKIFTFGINFQGDHWAGFSSTNQFFLFKNWKCRSENILTSKPFQFAVVTSYSCTLAQKKYDLDKECLKEFNIQMCNKASENMNTKIEKYRLDEKITFINLVDDFINLKKENGTDFILKNSTAVTIPIIVRRRTTFTAVSSIKTTSETTATDTTETDSDESSTETTSTEESSTETTSTEESSTETTSTEESSTETTSTEKTSTKTTTENTVMTEGTTNKIKTSTPTTALSESYISSTTKIYPTVNKTCECNEIFFQDHCYFFYSKTFPKREFLDSKNTLEALKGNFSYIVDEVYESEVNFSRFCQNRHPKALGLAVESKTENKFIIKLLKKLNFPFNFTIFTSGIRINKQYDRWQGWNLEINKNILNFGDNKIDDTATDIMFYAIHPTKGHWLILKNIDPILWFWRFGLMCKRPYNPKNIQLELHEICLHLYRKSSCYNIDFHSNYCCEKDETNEIWLACPDETYTKIYSNGLKCEWTCKRDGFFSKDRPLCTGSNICNSWYNNISYIAPVTRYAISDCPKPNTGHSTWYCHMNQTFLGTPDHSLCCATPGKWCRGTDIFLNVWMGCPSRKIIKKTACPPGSSVEEAYVEWYCRENGTFNDTTPDYSNCSVFEKFCKNKDRYGSVWMAKVGTTQRKNCPLFFTGTCSWKCENSGHFDGPEPDCTKCRAGWMDEVSDKIKNCSSHEEVMNLMENHTKKEDLRIGYSHVLHLTSKCVTLFKNQSSKSEINIFDRFLRSYSKIFKNVAGNSSIWLSFSVSNREEYSRDIIKITQDAAFANLVSKDITELKYNATLASSKTDGFDFFVAYNPPVGSQFPLENFSDSDWHLSIKEINDSRPVFAAVGIVMSHSLSSLMFPQRNTTTDLELNAPAITFTVAASRNNEVLDDPNVVVSISFKHNSRLRFPATKVIKRKLHYGERPSGVFNSSICCYYRNSEWSTEGCFPTFISKDRTNCTCNHLSTIALLMAIHKYEPDLTLEFISLTSSGITIASLILALLVFHFADSVKNDRVFISQNLCFCLLVGHLMLITVMDKKFFNIPDNMCMVYAIFLHYTFMAAFAWMFVEGCHLYRMLILVFDSDREYKYIYLLIGYGVPFVIVGVTELIGLLLQEQPYGQDELCWLDSPHYVWAFIGPVIVSTSINFCILIIAMKLAISSKRRTEKSSNFRTFKLWIKGWISLSTLLGVTWLFGLPYINSNHAFVYVFAVFNGLQGFFIFLFRCVLCEQYKVVILKKLKSWFLSSKSKHHKKSENMKSETKECAISAAKSSSSKTDGKYLERDPDLINVEENKKCQRNLIFFLNNERKNKEISSRIGADPNISITPAISEAYLRNRLIARNFSARKSKVV